MSPRTELVVAREPDPFSDFRVDTTTHVLSAVAGKVPSLWIRLGALETQAVERQLRPLTLQAPVFVSGLARAGSTLLLEYLAAHDGAATHRYRDFPFVLIPYWWNRLLDSTPRHDVKPAERAHRDGVVITPESPEAMEEIVWCTFLPRLHDPSTSNVLDAAARHPAFERFYRDHIRKLLLVRRGKRYVAKNNYDIVRLAYLRRLFPDCRFVIPLREPSSHIASLIKQHRLFCRAQRCHPRARAYLRHMGHFEFGLDRSPINAGDSDTVSEIRALLERGDEVRGLARYWAHVYGYVSRLRDQNPDIRDAGLVVRFEELCERPASVLERISAHCGLHLSTDAAAAFASRVRYPRYYRPSFSDQELAAIHEETSEVAARFGYSPRPQT
ncbi:MAG: sulfotransferase [Chitinivibrionales bacterium]|nr:sulfotransferase [Chitinivibrionales bacterium]